jgi:hypothetical protein
MQLPAKEEKDKNFQKGDSSKFHKRSEEIIDFCH